MINKQKQQLNAVAFNVRNQEKANSFVLPKNLTSFVTHIKTPQGLEKIIKPSYTHEDVAEFSYLMKYRTELDDIERYLVSKSQANIFNETVSNALPEIRATKQYVRTRSNYLSKLLTEPRYRSMYKVGYTNIGDESEK